ncbi:MAG: hypothetical protein WCA38_01550 [Candidatus Acidiferrales bacterium]
MAERLRSLYRWFRYRLVELGRKVKWAEATQLVSSVILAAVGIIALWIYYGQLEEMRSSTKAAKDAVDVADATLNVSQRAYVTVGRKDGVVADFVIPKDAKEHAEIVIYFQNTGRLPAKFTWGLLPGAFLLKGSKKQSSGISIAQPYSGGLPTRTRDVKTGSIGEQGASYVIAGDSVFVGTGAFISQKDLAELPINDMGLLILGQYDYCDELGTRSSRMFGIQYRSHAPTSSLSFSLAQDTPGMVVPTPTSTATTEYLFPCETVSELKAQQEKATAH